MHNQAAAHLHRSCQKSFNWRAQQRWQMRIRRRQNVTCNKKHYMSGKMRCPIMFIYVFRLTVQLSTMATPVKLRLKKRTAAAAAAARRTTTTKTMLVIFCAILFGQCLSGHYACRSLYFIIHLAHLFLFRTLSLPLCMCVCWSARKRCQFLAVFAFMSCSALVFNAFYLLYFLAIRLWTFVLVRAARVSASPTLTRSVLSRVALRGWGEQTRAEIHMCVCVCVRRGNCNCVSCAVRFAVVSAVCCCYCL